MIRRALALLALLCGLLAAGEARAISFIQAKSGDFIVASASLTVTVTATTAGSTLLACGTFDSASTGGGTISDPAADTVTTLFTNTLPSGETSFKVFCGFIATATTGTTSVKVTFSGTNPGFGDMGVWEIGGLTSPSADQQPVAGGDTAAPTVSTGTLSTAAEAAITYCSSGNNCNTTITGSSWTEDFNTPNTGSTGGHLVTAATTALTATYNSGLVAQFTATIITLKSAGAAVVTPQLMLQGMGQ